MAKKFTTKGKTTSIISVMKRAALEIDRYDVSIINEPPRVHARTIASERRRPPVVMGRVFPNKTHIDVCMVGVLVLPLWVRRITDTTVYQVFVALLVLNAVYLSAIHSWIDGPLGLIVVGMMVMAAIFETQYMDRNVLRAIVGTFQFWYLTLLVVVYAVGSWLHYGLTVQHSQDTSHMYLSVPTFLVSYMAILCLDAYELRPQLNTLWIKRGVMFLAVLNGLRFLLGEQLWNKHREIENVPMCFLFCVNAQDMRSGAMFSLTFYFLRMFYIVMALPNSLLLLEVNLRHQYDIVGHQSASATSSSDGSNSNLEERDNDFEVMMIDDLSISDSGGVRENHQGRETRRFAVGTKGFSLEWNLKEQAVLRVGWLRHLALSKYYNLVIGFASVALLLVVATLHVPVWVAILLNVPIVFLMFVTLARAHRVLFWRLVHTFDWFYLMFWAVVWAVALGLRNWSRSEEGYTNKNKGRYASPLAVLVSGFMLPWLDAMKLSRATARVVWIVSGVLLTLSILDNRFLRDMNREVKWCHLWCSSTYSLRLNAQFVFFFFFLKFLFFFIYRPNQYMLLRTRLYLRD